MDSKQKTKKLEEIAIRTICDPKHREENLFLMNKMNLSQREVVDTYIQYDLNVNTYENEFYRSLAARMVLHLKYQQKESWHNLRQQQMIELLCLAGRRKIIDLGFGAPSRYVRDYVFQHKDVSLTLADRYTSALKFAKTLLDYWSPYWKERINLKRHDMNEEKVPQGYDLYIFQDSIEHVRNPEKYLKGLRKDSLLLFSLPICKKSSSHQREWHTSDQAKEWIELQGLKSVGRDCERIVSINPKIDLFAEQLNWKVQNYMCICIKS